MTDKIVPVSRYKHGSDLLRKRAVIPEHRDLQDHEPDQNKPTDDRLGKIIDVYG